MARAVGVAVSRLATTLVATISAIIFFSFYPPSFFPSPVTFSHRWRGRIKKLIERKLIRAPKNLRVEHLPDPVDHFEAP